MIRRLSAFPLLALAALAPADRLISVPTARKLLDGTYRLETLRQFGRGANGIDYLAAGLGPSWEAEARVFRSEGRDPRATLDLTYNVISPVSDLSPGFAFGVQDLADRSAAGFRAFGCTTIRSSFNNGNAPFDVTIGLFAGRRVSPYVGASIPLYPFARLMAEHDGRVGQVGFEAKPLKNLAFRVIARQGDILGSVGYATSF